MFYTASTLGQFRDAIDAMIRWAGPSGPNTPIGTLWKPEPPHAVGRTGALMSDSVTIEAVFIRSQEIDIPVVGDEANDYEPKDGEFPAVLVT